MGCGINQVSKSAWTGLRDHEGRNGNRYSLRRIGFSEVDSLVLDA
jgi:hypothetical protein